MDMKIYKELLNMKLLNTVIETYRSIRDLIHSWVIYLLTLDNKNTVLKKNICNFIERVVCAHCRKNKMYKVGMYKNKIVVTYFLRK